MTDSRNDKVRFQALASVIDSSAPKYACYITRNCLKTRGEEGEENNLFSVLMSGGNLRSSVQVLDLTYKRILKLTQKKTLGNFIDFRDSEHHSRHLQEKVEVGETETKQRKWKGSPAAVCRGEVEGLTKETECSQCRGKENWATGRGSDDFPGSTPVDRLVYP